MEYTVDYLPDKKIVSVKMRGSLNFQIAEQYSWEAIKLARQNDCTKFLFDHTETTMQGGVNKIHMSGEELQQFGFQITDRIAIVIKHGNSSVTVSHNNRWSESKYFDNVQEAVIWLVADK